MSLNIELIRSKFPALSLEDNGLPRIYFDNPAGTQVPQHVIDRMTHYMIQTNANQNGFFRTSKETNAILGKTHRAVADLLNAPSPDEVIFGANMTTLTFSVSRALAHWFKPGDEIIVTRMDHDANVMPWVQMAYDKGIEVKWLNFDKQTFCYNLDEFESLLSKRVRLVAVNYASNLIGTINDVKTITDMAHAHGALAFVDAGQYAPHAPTDVQEIGCDFLVCSSYKFFGPHQGVLWGKEELLEELTAYKVRPANDHIPGKFETGTQSHEGQAGTLGAIDYLTWIGETSGQEYFERYVQFNGRRKYLHAAMAAIKEYEKKLSAHLIKGLKEISGTKIYGISELTNLDERVPTVSFTLNGFSPIEVVKRLGEENIFVWSGDNYAVEVVSHLGLTESGGMIRVGPVHYNTTEEIDKFLAVLSWIKSH